VSLRAQIEEEIREHGPIPFSRYMEICLYDPAAGYYSRNAEQFGKAGDFYTSSDVHAVFGRLLAPQFHEMWKSLDVRRKSKSLNSARRGLFARDVLDWSKKKLPHFFAALRYTLQEASPVLRTRLRGTLCEHITTGKAVVPEERANLARRISAGKGQSKGRVQEGRPDLIHRTCRTATPLIIFANEFFDALPVKFRPGK
jgi:SAM-dependent MidA family methyltransferase